MRPSNNKVDMEDFVFHFSSHRGYVVPSNPNSNSSANNFSYVFCNSVNNFCKRTGIRQLGQFINSGIRQGKPFFFDERNSLFYQGNQNSHFNQHRAGPSFVCYSCLHLLVIETPVFWLEFQF